VVQWVQEGWEAEAEKALLQGEWADLRRGFEAEAVLGAEVEEGFAADELAGCISSLGGSRCQNVGRVARDNFAHEEG